MKKELTFRLNVHDSDEYVCKRPRIEVCAVTLAEYFKLPTHKAEGHWGTEKLTPDTITLIFNTHKIKDSYFAIVPDDYSDVLIEDTWSEYILQDARKFLIKHFPEGCYVRCEYDD